MTDYENELIQRGLAEAYKGEHYFTWIAERSRKWKISL